MALREKMNDSKDPESAEALATMRDKINHVRVLARSSPEDKLQLVRLLKVGRARHGAGRGAGLRRAQVVVGRRVVVSWWRVQRTACERRWRGRVTRCRVADGRMRAAQDQRVW